MKCTIYQFIYNKPLYNIYGKYVAYPDSSRISGATYVGVPQTRNWGSCTSVAKPKSATFRDSTPFGLYTTCGRILKIYIYCKYIYNRIVYISWLKYRTTARVLKLKAGDVILSQ